MKKIEDLNLLFVNMHHLVNGYRPHQVRISTVLVSIKSPLLLPLVSKAHAINVQCIFSQARETLKVIMERQKKQRDDAISLLDRY